MTAPEADGHSGEETVSTNDHATSSADRNTTAQADSVLDRIDWFCDQMDVITSALSTEQRAATVSDLGVLDLALKRLRESIHQGSECSETLSAALERAFDRLDSPAARLVTAPGRADRSRHLDFLVERAGEEAELVAAIGRHLEPSLDYASYRSALAIAAETSFLVNASRKLDLGLDKLHRVATAHRNDGELRQQRYELELERYSENFAQLLESSGQQVDVAIGKVDAGVRSVEAKAEWLYGEVKHIVERDLVTKIVERHEQEGAREGRAANTWRIVGLIFALLVLAPLVYLVPSDQSDSLASVVLHLSLSTAIGAIAAYCFRQSAEHRREERQLRTEQLKAAASINAMSGLPDREREALQGRLARTYLDLGHSDAGPVSPESLSLLPIGQMLTGATELLNPKPQPAPTSRSNPEMPSDGPSP